MTGHDRLLDEIAELLADRVALQGQVVRLTDELAMLREITDNYDREADAVADLAVERYRRIQTLEARCARLESLNDSMQRQVLDLAVHP